jgi:hypothetical protein
MTDAEKLRIIEVENKKLMEENEKFRQVIKRLNQTLNKLIGHYITHNEVA